MHSVCDSISLADIFILACQHWALQWPTTPPLCNALLHILLVLCTHRKTCMHIRPPTCLLRSDEYRPFSLFSTKLEEQKHGANEYIHIHTPTKDSGLTTHNRQQRERDIFTSAGRTVQQCGAVCVQRTVTFIGHLHYKLILS